MPKSKEFLDSSDSASDGESRTAAATSKKPKAKSSNDKNDVSSYRENKPIVFLLNLFFICISLQLNELKQLIKEMMV
jgi:hypothetical protein